MPFNQKEKAIKKAGFPDFAIQPNRKSDKKKQFFAHYFFFLCSNARAESKASIIKPKPAACPANSPKKPVGAIAGFAVTVGAAGVGASVASVGISVSGAVHLLFFFGFSGF